jgi:hypothetical protein
MPARHWEPKAQRKARKRDINHAPVRLEHAVKETNGGLGVSAEPNHLSRARSHRHRGKACVVLIVSIQYDDPARFESEEDFRFGIGDRVYRGEEAEMGRFDSGDHRDVRPHQPSETGYFAGMIHTQLEYPVTGIGRHSGKREGDTPVIVEATGRRKSWAGDGKSETQCLFGAGFAHTAGDRDDLGIATISRSRSESHQAGQCVGDTQQGHEGQIRDAPVHHCRSGSALEGGTDEIMTVVIGALQRNE